MYSTTLILSIRYIADKTLYRQGGVSFIPQGQADIAGGRHIKFAQDNVIRNLFENELGKNADTESAFYHGHDGVVVPRRVYCVATAKNIRKSLIFSTSSHIFALRKIRMESSKK